MAKKTKTVKAWAIRRGNHILAYSGVKYNGFLGSSQAIPCTITYQIEDKK